jgi:type IV pilus assembly protein PilA
MKKFFKYGNKGFTLIELLVVIAILGTLAAVVILNVTKYIGSGRTEARATEQANVQTAVVAYMYDNPSVISFPATVATPSSAGILAPYFLNSLNCTYTIPLGGAVPAGTGCTK